MIKNTPDREREMGAHRVLTEPSLSPHRALTESMGKYLACHKVVISKIKKFTFEAYITKVKISNTITRLNS